VRLCVRDQPEGRAPASQLSPTPCWGSRASTANQASPSPRSSGGRNARGGGCVVPAMKTNEGAGRFTAVSSATIRSTTSIRNSTRKS